MNYSIIIELKNGFWNRFFAYSIKYTSNTKDINGKHSRGRPNDNEVLNKPNENKVSRKEITNKLS